MTCGAGSTLIAIALKLQAGQRPGNHRVGRADARRLAARLFRRHVQQFVRDLHGCGLVAPLGRSFRPAAEPPASRLQRQFVDAVKRTRIAVAANKVAHRLGKLVVLGA